MFLLFFVNVAHAAELDSFIRDVNRVVLNPLILLMFGVAIVYFLYGVFQFVHNQDSEEGRSQGRQHMIWGVIGIVIMMGVYNILGFVMNALNLDDSYQEINLREGEVKLKEFEP